MRVNTIHEGFGAARLLMVISSMSPLFVLWGARGSRLIPDHYLLTACGLAVILPNAFLWLRVRTAKRLHEKRELSVGSAEDHRDHVLVYLFAMLLPFYPIDLASIRDLVALILALLFIIFIFVYLNLHYTNPMFALLGYRVFTIYPPQDINPITGRAANVLVTRRPAMDSGERVIAYRLSDTVYLEVE